MFTMIPRSFRSPRSLRLMAAVGVLLLAPGLASAYPTFSFVNITNNNAVNAGTGGQFSVEVVGSNSQVITNYDVGGTLTDVLMTQTLFVFRNLGPAASAITDIYFDDGTLLGIAEVVNGSGTNFSQGAAPPNLPGGQAINFQTTAGFLADSQPPVPTGVQPGRAVGILFNLKDGQNYQSVLDSLALGFANLFDKTQPIGSLRIGIHVQGYANEGSESFVAQVPEPSSLAVAGLSTLALLGLGLRRRNLARA